MKSLDYTTAICKDFCKFFKEGREEMVCGGYALLARNLTCKELDTINCSVEKSSDPSFFLKDRERDDAVRLLVCDSCDFLVDGCDFRDNASNPPCGGYIIVYSLVR